MSFLFIIFQYAALGLIVGFIFYRNTIARLVTGPIQTAPPTRPQAQEDRPLAKRRSRPATRPTIKSEITSTANVGASIATPDKASDDTAFARELALTQKGTDLKKKSDPKERQVKTKRQAQAEEGKVASQKHQSKTLAREQITRPRIEQPANDQNLAVSGAAGMETDYGAHIAEVVRIAADDVPAPVPYETEWTSIPTKAQKVQKKVERAEETKKQRQRQAQKEQYRELKEEADQQQRALMEKQRREARIARGEPAKNGERYKEISAPSKSVWSHLTTTSDTNENGDGLLDTIDHSVADSNGPIIANGEDATNGEDS